MMWKKFTVSLFFIILAATSSACIFPEIGGKHVYMFKSYEYCDTFYGGYVDNINFWYGYVQGNVSKSEIEKALYECSADEIYKGTNGFFRYLHSINDADALQYWTFNKSFSVKNDDPWYYPSRAERQELLPITKKLETVLQNCSSKQLKERYVYLMMRLTFNLKNHENCRTIWEKYGGTLSDKDMRRRCQLYFAGALFYSGEQTKAADIYAENEDWVSLLSFDKSVAFMEKLYAESPSSKAFTFFVQKYVNRFQDMMSTADCSDFITLCEKVVSEKKSDNIALWQSAMAHIAFLRGDVKKAVELIEKASKMRGDALTNDNVRMLRLLYHAADTSAVDYDGKLYQDLPWLIKKVCSLDDLWAKNNNGYAHSLSMLWRVVFVHALPYYSKTGRHNIAIAMLNAYDEAYCYDREMRAKMRANDTSKGSMEYSTSYFSYLDTTTIENVQNFLAFIKSGGKTNLEKFLVKAGYVRESMINELIGTKFLRIHKYDSALVYLEKVQSSFWKKQNITEYLDRNPFVENWISSQQMRGHAFTLYNAVAEYDSAPTKLQFCKIMLELEQRQGKTSDKEEQASLNYAYAVGMVQSINGWCWALTQYAQGSSINDNKLFSTIANADDLQQKDNGWEYRTSKSLMLQKRYLTIINYLDKAEKLTKDSEMAARCRYMRYVIELDRLQNAQICRRLLRDYADTRFVNEESRHCATLADYR